MSMFSPYWKCKYDELITFYPRFYREVLEMDAILRAEGGLADGVQDGIERLLLNNFVETADEATLNTLMDYYGVAVTSTQTAAEKRGLVKMCLIGEGKVSSSLIKDMLAAYTNAETVISFEPFDDEGNERLVVHCVIPDGEKFVLSDVKSIIEKKIPAHIVLLLSEAFEMETDIHTDHSVLLVNVNFRWRLPFLEIAQDVKTVMGMRFAVTVFHKLKYFDGTWNFDGSELLNADCLNWVTVSDTAIRAKTRLSERFSHDVESYRGNINYWQTAANSGVRQGVTNITTKVNALSEEFLADEVVIQRNLWYFDGSVSFGDARKLNAYISKEAI